MDIWRTLVDSHSPGKRRPCTACTRNSGACIAFRLSGTRNQCTDALCYKIMTLQKLLSLCHSYIKHAQTNSILMTSKEIQCNLKVEESVAKRKFELILMNRLWLGWPSLHFELMFPLSPNWRLLLFTLQLEDLLLILLLKLKQDTDIGMVCKMFKVSHSYVSKVINVRTAPVSPHSNFSSFLNHNFKMFPIIWYQLRMWVFVNAGIVRLTFFNRIIL